MKYFCYLSFTFPLSTIQICTAKISQKIVFGMTVLGSDMITKILSAYSINVQYKLSMLIVDSMDTYVAACKSPEVGTALTGIQGPFTPRRGFCSAKIPGTFSKHKGSAGLSTASWARP